MATKKLAHHGSPEQKDDDLGTGSPEKAPGGLLEDLTPTDTVIVTVPKAFQLRVDNHRVLEIKAGTQNMDKKLAEHWYSKANGVTIFDQNAE